MIEIAEKVEPGIYHVHLDATSEEGRLREEMLRLGYEPDDFVGHPEGYSHFEPNAHLTKKVRTQDDFLRSWDELVSIADRVGVVGYLEGEYIRTDELIPYQPYRDAKPAFRITRRRLHGGTGEQFRQAEIHLTMDKDRSDPRLIRHLLDAGLYGAYLPKPHGTFIILTIQGYTKHVFAVSNAVREYLSEVGGAAGCTLKEEIAIRYKLYGINPDQLPEIADNVVIS